MGLLWEEYIVRLKEKERHAFTGLALFIVCINLLPSSSALIVLCKDSDYFLNIKIISYICVVLLRESRHTESV